MKLDVDFPHHAVPVVIGAAQRVMAGLARDEVEIFALCGMQQDLGQAGLEHVGVFHLDRRKELRRGELVHFLALVLEAQSVEDAAAKRELVGEESIVDKLHRDELGVDPLRERRRGLRERHAGT